MRFEDRSVQETSPSHIRSMRQALPVKYATTPTKKYDQRIHYGNLSPSNRLTSRSPIGQESVGVIREVIFLQRSPVSPIRKRIIEAPEGTSPQVIEHLNNNFRRFEQEIMEKFSTLNDRASKLVVKDQVQENPEAYRTSFGTTRNNEYAPIRRDYAERSGSRVEPSFDSPLKQHHMTFNRSGIKVQLEVEEPKNRKSNKSLHNSQTVQVKARREEDQNEETAAKKTETASIIRNIESDKELEKETPEPAKLQQSEPI